MQQWEYILGFRMLQGGASKLSRSPMTILSILGVAFCVTAALVSLSVMSGFEKAYKKAILAFNAHIVLIREGEIENIEQVKSQLDFFSREGIEALSPFVFREGLGIFPNEVSQVMIKGIDPRTAKDVYPLGFATLTASGQKEGILDDDQTSTPPVLLGLELAKKYFPNGIPKEPVITVMIPGGGNSSNKMADFRHTFKVAGTFESGLHEFDGQFVLTSLLAMQRIFRMGGNVSGIELALGDPGQAPRMARLIEERLGGSFQAISWDELNEELFSALKMEKTIFLVIMALILMIAGFNIVGVILMLVLGKEREIGILWALGGCRRSIGRVFATQGFVIGASGTGLGSLLAALLVLSLSRAPWFRLDPEIYFVSSLPVNWSWGFALILMGLTLLFCHFLSVSTARNLIKKIPVSHLL